MMNRMNSWKSMLSVLCILWAGTALGQPAGHDVLPLYQTPVEPSTNGEQPALILYPAPAESANGCAVVICPGGAYTGLAIDKEGYEVAERFNRMGVSAFVLKYRLPQTTDEDDDTTMPLTDAQAAIRLVRANAAQWHVDPQRVGIIGFSAGGHLAATADTHWQPLEGKADMQARPDFAILVYPVITMGTTSTHGQTRKRLLGEHPSEALVRAYSNETRITPQTPPTMLVHASDDQGVPVENSLMFYRTLVANGVPAEMHIYEKGGHGFGSRPEEGGVAATWPDRAEDWLRARGTLARP